ncbi:MAG: helicase-related protein [Rhodobacteraceae bacterium]|nr:helicase-related protein [Paracoccaceae bacterium]
MHDAQVKAVLGPTNTGKTWYAIERMLEHRTGMIGLPLRLLAREVYDRVREARGPSSVALVTGEERIIPKQASYWVCTVEAMPQASGVEFLAVDEIQLCGDEERGHVFTQRLLSARGLSETVFLGSETMRGLIAQLVPEASFKSRRRFSELTYTGMKKISRIKPRSAIVCFSVEDVYAIAEAVRQRRGGAAVVLGALSPRTRNAQVGLYQNGDVEILVATDAIGMGLNLDIDHVAFAGLTKFDGRRVRPLGVHEIGQIAGRAGRYRSPGTFGVTSDAEPLEAPVSAAIEESRFRQLRKLQWRNSDLDFRSIASLLASLTLPSENPLLTRAREAEDITALRDISELAEIRDRVTRPADVRLLWDVCQVPDFRKISSHEHTELLRQIFVFLQDRGEIPAEWLESQVQRIDRIDGDVDTLSRRIAFGRTWTFVSQKVDWLSDIDYWRQRTRTLEDRISDALHASLTRRFVDRRISVLRNQLKRKENLLADVDAQGVLTVEGERVGKIEGFRFFPERAASEDEARMMRQASAAALTAEFSLRASRLFNAPNQELGITEQGSLMWGDLAVGKLSAGHDKFAPEVRIFTDDEVGVEACGQIERRLQAFVSQKISAHLGPILKLRDDETVTGLARGIAFRLCESYGVLLRMDVAEDIKALDQDARKSLRAHGVRFSQHTIFMFSALKPEATRLRILLWSLAQNLSEFPPPPPPGLVTVAADAALPQGYYPLSGFYRAGGRAVRVDMLDRLLGKIREMDGRAGFEATADMLSFTGLSLPDFAELMTGLGYRAERGEREKVRKPAQEGTAAPQTEVPDAEDSAGESVTGKEVEAEQEEFFTFYWRPRPRPEKQESRQRRRPAENRRHRKPRRDNESGSERRKTRPTEKVAKAAEPDPDSPFAVLAGLKTSLDS